MNAEDGVKYYFYFAGAVAGILGLMLALMIESALLGGVVATSLFIGGYILMRRWEKQ